MSELEKAKQEVEQVCFAYDKAGDTGDIKDWKEFYDLENKLIEKVKIANQPQLTIPKSVADLLDKFIEFVFEDIGHEEWWIQENGLIEWFSKTPNCYIKDAYLAGKALGVDLVKVVEG
ncbi:hypothetical protein [Lactococcus lactis]|uniref:hypothetical protein n=1 Tax=Lactococcus lactis TaxID=1358 RepID=UPI001D083BF0|nr:hypothetical protein [Lactococcus lactis]MCB6852864.1 hypothetical protein [Lactococcus lactis]MDU6581884.1 hypothetical protein [Lactococcus lactis]